MEKTEVLLVANTKSPPINLNIFNQSCCFNIAYLLSATATSACDAAKNRGYLTTFTLKYVMRSFSTYGYRDAILIIISQISGRRKIITFIGTYFATYQPAHMERRGTKKVVTFRPLAEPFLENWRPPDFEPDRVCV